MDPKLCGVCGDKALGNNFNAITCESCKAFFRRNALRTKEFVCPFNNNCKVDAITRRFCQRCRLKKCFDIGMKKEWIMSDEEKKIKKQKIEQNRKKRSSLENSGVAGEPSPQDEDDNGDLEDAAPVAKKPHVFTTECRQTEPVVSDVAFSIEGSGGDNSALTEANTDDLSNHSPKMQKQPMGLHNKKEKKSCNRKPKSQTATSRKGGKGKNSHGENVISIQVSTSLSPSLGTSSPSSPSSVSSNPQNQPTTITTSVNGASKQHSQHQYVEHTHQQEMHHISQQSMEFDSSNSTLSPPTPSNNQHLVHSQLNPYHNHQPPPLVKYPPNKRSRIYEHRDSIEEHHLDDHSASHDHSTPLLSSLIKPSYPESSPDHTSSPPSSQLVQYTDTHSNSDDNEVHYHHLQRNSVPFYHPPTVPSSESPSSHRQVLRHHPDLLHSHPSYHDEYGRLSPPPHSPSTQSTYQNGYHHHPHHHHHYSPPYSAELDNHHYHHGYHLSQIENQQQQHSERNLHHAPVGMPSMDSILSIAIAAEFNSFGMLGGNIPNSKNLNKAEQAKLNELLLASQALHAPVDAERPIPKESNSSDPSLLNVINLTEIAIRRLIKMSKKISGFKYMCQEDQIALLKGSCTEMMILRSVVTYDPDRDSWQIPHSNPGYNINLGVLKEARGNLYEEHQRFVKSFRSQWRKDENIMIILCAITLFTPERHNVIHRDVVKLEQDSYYYLLKRYLESILNGCEAKSNYLQLIQKVAELRALNSSHVRAYLEMNPKEVEPLLIEIFDLK